MSSGFKNLQKWKDGSFFATTTTAVPSTPAPSTTTTTVASTKGPSTKGPTGGVTIHPAPTTKGADTATTKKIFQESAAANTPITSADIDRLVSFLC
ncbi:unnamed protein product [Nippostrongylus brasiliensis]|uniref:GYF domain-containing protein n=1 Tax=Nippostrongylus brasiliensis TaxID=27835 RepID=A0A0N4XKC6_NIPBR|nr:unnamed protein product [Nippostrongylus brasiliensis]